MQAGRLCLRRITETASNSPWRPRGARTPSARPARAAHTLISTAAMLGASALAELARELHDAIDVGAPERWPALLARIDAVQSDVDVRVTECLRAAPSHEQATG